MHSSGMRTTRLCIVPGRWGGGGGRSMTFPFWGGVGGGPGQGVGGCPGQGGEGWWSWPVGSGGPGWLGCSWPEGVGVSTGRGGGGG